MLSRHLKPKPFWFEVVISPFPFVRELNRSKREAFKIEKEILPVAEILMMVTQLYHVITAVIAVVDRGDRTFYLIGRKIWKKHF